MHNIAEEKIFRPKAWVSFGTSDLEGADFRACANFEPLYGRKAILNRSNNFNIFIF